MKFDDLIWIDRWSKELYAPISSDYRSQGFGTDDEPRSSLCLASFAEAMGDNFKENVNMFDYGCGSARFCNFMSKRLKNFNYIGLEKPNSSDGHSQNAINYAKSKFGHDNRIKLGFLGTDLEKEAIEKSDTVLLLSVFTHTTIELTEEILKSLMPIVDRGGIVVFSMILNNNYSLSKIKEYGFEDCYALTNNTKSQIDNLKKILSVNIEEKDPFIADGNHRHSIFKMFK